MRALLSLPLIVICSCGGGQPTAPDSSDGLSRLTRLHLQLGEGQSLPEATVQKLWTAESLAEDLATWQVEGRQVEAGSDDRAGELIVAASEGGKRSRGEDLHLTLPGPFANASFNQVALTGRFRDVFEVGLTPSEGGTPIRLTTRKMTGHQTLVFDLSNVRSRGATLPSLSFLVKGPTPGFTLLGIDLIQVPDHLLMPSLGAEPQLIHQGKDSRAGYGLAPDLVAEVSLEVEHAEDRLAFSTTILPRFRPGPGAPRIEVELVGEDATLTRTVELPLDRSVWQDSSIALGELAGQSVTARFVYRCDVKRKGIAAIGDLRLWRPGKHAPTTLLISSDTHRADHVAASGLGVELDTPALDGLARDGLLFEDAWTTTNVTSPSHVAMLTGYHPRDTRLIGNQDRLVAEAHTLAEVFQQAGWRTVAAMSVRHLGPRGTNLGQGFDRVDCPTSGTPRAEEPVGVLKGWIEEAEGLPVLAFLHLFDAHHPYTPPASHDRRYYPADRDPFDPDQPAIEARRGSMPADYWGRLRDLEFPRAQYRAEVTYLDAELIRLLEVPRVADGLVAFTSDHGEILEKSGTFFNHGELYPDTLHVPLILAGGALPEEFRGRRFPDPISQLGLGRTLLDLSDLGGADFPGRNLLAQVDAGEGDEALFALSAHGKSASIRADGWFLLLHLADHQGTLAEPRKEHQAELFDLATDPACLNDRSAEEPERTAELRGRLVEWLLDAAPQNLSKTRNSTAQELAELAGLGYATSEEVIDESEPWYTPPR